MLSSLITVEAFESFKFHLRGFSQERAVTIVLYYAAFKFHLRGFSLENAIYELLDDENV